MVRRLEYSNNGIPYWFNLDSFSSEINSAGELCGLSLSEAICKYFDFSEETKYCTNCHYSKKFQTYILPLENHLGEKNFVMIKNDKVFNPNNFVGFAIGDKISPSPYYISDLNYALKDQDWIYFTYPAKELLAFVTDKYKCGPQFLNDYNSQVLHLLSVVPDSWNFNNDNILRVPNPTLEDRTILINLLPDEDCIEFGHEIIIRLNADNVGLLARHCITLYSILQ